MLKIIKKRRSIRKYQEKEVGEEKLNEILKAAMFSPSAAHRKPWEFVVVKDLQIKEKLSQATPYAGFAQDTPVVLVICADETKSIRWVEDCAIVVENIYLEATNQGLGTCCVQIRETKTPRGGSGEEYVRKIIKAPENIRVLCLMPLGYPAEQKEEHSDLEFEEIKIHQESF
jgi:nitroreductase